MSELATKPNKTKSGSQTRQRSRLAAMPCTPDELADVKSRAEKAGLKVSGFLRSLVFGKAAEQPRAARRPTVEAAELVRLQYELRKIGGNLNQIAHHLNQGQGFDAPAFATIYAEHAAALKAIMQAFGKEPPP
jgi:hypothetical protein